MASDRRLGLALLALRPEPAAHGPQQRREQHVLVVGATGLLGRAVVDRFRAREGWAVSSIARRELQGEHSSTHYQLDLTDAERCRSVLSSAPELAGVTQIVFTALYGSDVWDAEERDVNLAMLQNVVTPMLGVARGLRHVDLMQGRKAYPSQDLVNWPAKEQHTACYPLHKNRYTHIHNKKRRQEENA